MFFCLPHFFLLVFVGAGSVLSWGLQQTRILGPKRGEWGRLLWPGAGTRAQGEGGCRRAGQGKPCDWLTPPYTFSALASLAGCFCGGTLPRILEHPLSFCCCFVFYGGILLRSLVQPRLSHKTAGKITGGSPGPSHSLWSQWQIRLPS